jgi:hypothetical protein
MAWGILFHPQFREEFAELPSAVRIALVALLKPLEEYGPLLGRPDVDTLKDSKFANMKELRFQAAYGVWRVAFAFDPLRNAILLVGADKAGVSERQFYRRLIDKADRRFQEHLDYLKRKPAE